MARGIPFKHKGRPVNRDRTMFDYTLPTPDAEIAVDVVEQSADPGTDKLKVHVSIAEVPAGVGRLVVSFFNSDLSLYRTASAAVTPGGPAELSLGRVRNDGATTFVTTRYRSLSGDLGPESSLTNVTDLIPPDPNLPLAFRGPPSLILDPVLGLREGATLDAREGVFNGAQPGSAVKTLWVTDAADDDPATEGTLVPSFTFPGPIPSGFTGKFPWPRSAITNGTTTLYEFAESTPGPITAIPDPNIVLPAGSITLEGMHNVGGGLWQPILKIDPEFLDPADFLGLDHATGLNIDAFWTRLTTTPENMIANARMPLVPAQWVGGDAPVLPAQYTNALGYWRVNEFPAATIANAGGTWEDSWARKEGRQQDITEPFRELKFRAGMGTGRGPVTSWYLSPRIPAAPPDDVEFYWSPMERTEAQALEAPNEHGLAGEYMRSFMACEDEPQYIVGGGDMNGIHLSDTMGRTWFHPDSVGLRPFAFNSVAIDPRNRNYLLAVGNLAWMAAKAGYPALAGIWRSTDFGATWSIRQIMMNASADEWHQELFCYDPASRAGSVGSRIWYVMQSIRTVNQDSQGFQLWRSLDGGATWNTLGPQLAASTFGLRAYTLKMLPTGRLVLSTKTGVWRSSADYTSWTRPYTDLPNAKTQKIEVSPDGTKMYAFVSFNGLWYSSNSGTSWTRKYTGDVKTGTVDWGMTPETVYINLNLSSRNGLIHSYSGAGNGPWLTSTVTPMRGFENNPYYSYTSLGFSNVDREGYHGIYVPRPGVVIQNMVGRMFFSDDAGTHFDDACQGFTGLNSQATGRMLWTQDPRNETRYAVASQDINVLYVPNLRWMEEDQIPDSLRAQLGRSSPGSTYCVDILPTGTVLAGIGSADNQGMCRRPNGTGGWVAIPAATNGGPLIFIGHHPTSSPTAIIAGEKISKDDGITWPITFSGRVVGIEATGPAYVSRATHTELYRSSNWHNTNPPVWSPFYQGPSFEKFGFSNPIVKVSQAEARTVWTEGAGGDLIRVRNPGTSFNTQEVKSFPLTGLPGAPTGNLFMIADIAPDPNDPKMVYVTLFGSGWTGTVWRGRITGSEPNEVMSWTNITVNAPKWQDMGIYVFPHTGDVVISGGVGYWVFPPPAGYQAEHGLAASRWSQLARPIKVPQAA
jgi:hypothetical protein